MNKKSIPLPGSLAITITAYSLLAFAFSKEPPPDIPSSIKDVLSILPHAIAIVNTIALSSLILGWRAIKNNQVKKHRNFMVLATVFITAFLVLYVTRVTLGGIKMFRGPRDVYTYIYLPSLTVHITLSIVSIPLVVFNILIGMTHSFSEIHMTKHVKVGRIAVTLWSLSLALGLLAYMLLNIVY